MAVAAGRGCLDQPWRRGLCGGTLVRRLLRRAPTLGALSGPSRAIRLRRGPPGLAEARRDSARLRVFGD